jgi:hypothetical protein
MSANTRHIVLCAAIGGATAALLLVLFGGMRGGLESVFLLLFVAILGIVCGTFVGLVGWLMRSRSPMTKRRLFITRAAMGAVLSLALLVTVTAAWGGVFGIQAVHTGADPGIGGALFVSIGAVVLFGIPTILLGAATGGIGALIAGRGLQAVAAAEPDGKSELTE